MGMSRPEKWLGARLPGSKTGRTGASPVMGQMGGGRGANVGSKAGREVAEYAARFPRRMEEWLDADHGECILRGEASRRCMDGVLGRSEVDGRCRLHAYVVMPNHVHVLCELPDRAGLPALLQEWKGVSAHLLNRLPGRQGAVWQGEYHDRLIRNGEHCRRAVGSIRKNWESLEGRETSRADARSVNPFRKRGA